MLRPDELDAIAQVTALLAIFVAIVFLAAGQPLRSTWISLLGGGFLVAAIQLYAVAQRLLE